MLEIKQLGLHFKQQEVLKDINLSIAPGQTLGLVGKNGAGKTSLFECLYGTYPHTGHITLHGEPLLRQQVAYLESESFYYPCITGEEYLHYFGQKNQEILALMDTYQLPLKKYVSNYSTGMKKKLSMLSILLQDQPVVLLDEPFNGVDFEGVLSFYQLIKQLKAQNKIVMINSHIIETLFNTCKHIAVLSNGQIERCLPAADFEAFKEYQFA